MTANPKLTKPAFVADPVRPNEGMQAAYRRQLMKLIDEMQRSIEYWLLAAYKREAPALAQDASPAAELQRVMRQLARRWTKRFAQASKELADYFATEMHKRSDVALRDILRRGGFSVRFTMTTAMNNVKQAAVHENVSLIKSIAAQHLNKVEGMVMRSVQTGRDLGTLSKELRKAYGVTKRRAALIARDQNNKATAVFTRVRQQELGITEAIWQHSHAGKEPRPTHVAAGAAKTRYKIAEGWLDPAINKRIWPGTEINCRCVSRPIIHGL